MLRYALTHVVEYTNVVCTIPCRKIYKLMPWYALTHVTNYTNSILNANSQKILIHSTIYVIRVVIYANSFPCLFTNKFHDSVIHGMC